MRLKQLFFSLSFLVVTTLAYAGHELGGLIIKYESDPGPTNNPLRYKITAYSLYDAAGVPPFNNISIGISSSCFANSSVSLSGSGNINPVTGLGYCVGNASGSLNLLMAKYTGHTILPGQCADFTFSTSSCCGRYSNMVNIAYNPASTDYFYAILNNTMGPNSTPEMNENDLIRLVCPNKALNFYSFTEPDGDSVYYSSSAPANISGTTVGNQSYSTGYSMSNQVGSSSGFTLNTSTGAVQTQINNSGQYAVTIKYQEYRPSLTGVPVLISESRVTAVLGVANSCTLPVFMMAYPPVPDADSVDCGARSIQVGTTRKISPASITPSGSEFVVNSTKKGALAVTSAQLLNDSLIEITLAQPIPSNDIVNVSLKTGSDGDIVVSICGQHLLGGIVNTLNYYSPAIPAASASFTNTSNFLDVLFNSSGSTGSSLTWDFGDGSPTSNMANPQHSYGAAGSYTVSLIAANSCGETDTVQQVIDVCDTLYAGSLNVMTYGDSVSLSTTGAFGVTSYNWDMGNGVVLTSLGGVDYTYPSPGVYTVTVTASNDCGDASTIVQTINVCAPVTAGFTAMPTGAMVAFDGSLSSANAVNYYWNLGDGNSATGMNYTHTYGMLGNYYVTLTVVNACMDSATFGDTVKLCEPAIPSWTYQIISSGALGLKIQFDASASQNARSYHWDFGDGNTGSGVNPQHTYNTVVLTYVVRLTVTNDCGEKESYAYPLNQVGIEENRLEPAIELYPNPANNRFVLSWNSEDISPDQVKLYTVSGKEVLKKRINAAGGDMEIFELDLSGITKGLYIIEVEGTGIFIREKLLVNP